MSIQEAVYDRQTKAFIDEHPSDVVIERKKTVTTAAGGRKREEDYRLLPQRCRVVRSSNRGDNVERTMADGRVLLVSGTAVFSPGADVEVNDTFQGEEHWQIVSVSRTPVWRVSCELALYGS